MPLKTLGDLRDWSITQWSLSVGMILFLGWSSSQLWSSWNGPTDDSIQLGQELFVHEWTANDPLSPNGDGLGPVFNAKSCVACHFQGGVGGAGPNEHNVTAFTAFSNTDTSETKIIQGVIHADALMPTQLETTEKLRNEFPIIKGVVRSDGHCSYQEADFNPLIVASINTPALFGMGEIDRISGTTIRNARRWKLLSNVGQELQGNFSSIPSGRPHILPDGRVGKFGWKAQFATLEEFVAAACAVEIGLTNHRRQQDLPHTYKPDQDAGLDIDRGQFKALVHFCASLPVPQEVAGGTLTEQSNIQHGRQLFGEVGCAACHTPGVDGVAGVYSDFLLYSLESSESGGDSYEEFPKDFEIPSGEPQPDEWKTPPLWGVADSAPYLHDGSAATLEAAISAHHGAARQAREQDLELDRNDQLAVLKFLGSLKAPKQPTTSSSETVIADNR